MIKAIIFDCFGVLVTDAFDMLMKQIEADNPNLAEELLDGVLALNRGKLSRAEFLAQMAPQVGMDANRLLERIEKGEVRNKDIFPYIKELRKNYKTAVLSNVSVEGFWRRFTREELREYFDVVVLSGEIGFAKPEPQAFQIAAQELGADLAECVMVDDRPEYLVAAQALGMQTVLYQSVPQLRQALGDLLAKQ